MGTSCLFCEIKDFYLENSFAYAIYDNFPVTKYHTLVIPKRHIDNYFDLTQKEITDIHDLLCQQKENLVKKDLTITGFNIGINCGKDAGQTIFHCHIHLIPRRMGDVENPVGGVRNVIQGKGDYRIRTQKTDYETV